VKKFFFIGATFVVSCMIVGTALILKHTTAADQAIYTCQSDGTFASQSTGPAAITSSDLSHVAAANTWLAGQMQPDVNIVTSSTITPDQDYTSSYTGATSGSFDLQGRTYSTTNPATIVVDSPATVPDSYRGVIDGHVTETPTPNRWIIQAYKDNNGVISQVPVQALADGTTGDFSIDLTNVDPSYTGQWMLGILDASNSYAEYGVKWPAPTQYVNLVVQELVVTDTTYLWATTPATTDGRFSFPNDQVGSKIFRLVESSTGDVLAQAFDNTGLIRSYEYQVGEEGYGTGIQDMTYLYDQATALYAAVSQNEASTASSLASGLLLMQTTSGAHTGGFVFAAPQLSPSYSDPYYRTGADAIAVDALLAYINEYPSDPNIATYKAAAVSGLNFLQSTYSSTGATAGLYLGGFGNYSGNPQVFDPTYVVTFASTEHNIDVWHAFTDASRILGNSPTNYTLLATNLNNAIQAGLYNTSAHRFNQGINSGLPDVGDPLDTNTWGSIQMYATGNVNEAQLALAHLSVFDRTVGGIEGYTPFYDTTDYPGAVPNVWFEGSFGAALAQFDAGNYGAYRTLLNQLTPAQQTDGSFRYAQAVDDTYGIGISESVASTAWYILATVGRGTIWNNCDYDALDVATTTPVTPTTPVTTSDTSTDSGTTTSKDTTTTTSGTGNDVTTPTPTSDLTTTSQPDDTISKPSSSAGTVTRAPTVTSTKKKASSSVAETVAIAGASVGVAGVGTGIGFGIARIRRRRGL
jgi:hypothetical protein